MSAGTARVDWASPTKTLTDFLAVISQMVQPLRNTYQHLGRMIRLPPYVVSSGCLALSEIASPFFKQVGPLLACDLIGFWSISIFSGILFTDTLCASVCEWVSEEEKKIRQIMKKRTNSKQNRQREENKTNQTKPSPPKPQKNKQQQQRNEQDNRNQTTADDDDEVMLNVLRCQLTY